MCASDPIERWPTENSPGLQAGVSVRSGPRVPQGRQKDVPVVPPGLASPSHQYPGLKAGAIFEEEGPERRPAESSKRNPAVGIAFGVPSSDGSACGCDRTLSCGVAQNASQHHPSRVPRDAGRSKRSPQQCPAQRSRLGARVHPCQSVRIRVQASEPFRTGTGFWFPPPFGPLGSCP